MPNSKLEARITELEIRVAEQEKQIDELSQIVTQHWKEIEEYRKKLNALINRFLVLEEQATPEIGVSKPPHW